MRTLLSSLKTYKTNNKPNEEGFTLLELIIVVVIIGILAGLLAPVFAVQQKEAMNASVKSDLRSAVTVLVTDATKNSGRFLPYLPSSLSISPNNNIYVDPERSSQFRLCLVGYNKENSEKVYYYDSLIGKVSDIPCTTLPTSSQSFSSASTSDLKNKKALVVYNNTSTVNSSVTQLQNLGYGKVDNVSGTGFAASTDTAIAQYDFIFLNFAFWSNVTDVRNKAMTYYNAGGIILQDGNDTIGSGNPFIKNSFTTTESADFNPTYTSGNLRPSFPFTFRDTAFASDASWRCITEIEGAVSLATSDKNGKTCHTMFAATNGSGKWLFMTTFGKGETSGVGNAALAWLTTKAS
jgi:prepilin-type N-terminal cleavage/methylation domain-containing protein